MTTRVFQKTNIQTGRTMINCDNCDKKMTVEKFNRFGDNVCSQECNIAKVSERLLETYGFEDEYSKKTLGLFDFSQISCPKYKGDLKAEIEKYIKNPDRNGWYFTSLVGRGKSHLALGITREIISKYAWRVKIIHTVDFMNSIKARLRNYQDIEGIIEKLKTTTLLVLDDLGIEMFGAPDKTKFSRDTMFEIIDHRVRKDLPMIVTSNYLIKDFPDERIASRLIEKCRVREIIGNDYRIRLNKKLNEAVSV